MDKLIRPLKVGDQFFVQDPIIAGPEDNDDTIEEINEIAGYCVSVLDINEESFDKQLHYGVTNPHEGINPSTGFPYEFLYYLYARDIDIEKTNELLLEKHGKQILESTKTRNNKLPLL